MRQGLPLDDAMRAPWLARVRGVLEDAVHERAGAVIACSALKARYRTFLSDGRPNVRFVLLNASRELLLQRLTNRRGHFAGPKLLDSQIDALEPPADALTLDASRPVAELVDAIRLYACEGL